MIRYVIAGSGPAGISAAEAIRACDPAGEIAIVSEESDGFYTRPGLAYFLSDEIPEKMLFPASRADLIERLRVRLLHGRIVRLLPDLGQVEMAGGAMLGYDRLLLATGSLAAPLQTPGAGLQGVVKLDNLDDARTILQMCRKARQAVVVGGGITALELVEGLRARSIEVHYFLRQDRYWSNVLDETESGIVEHELRGQGVRIYPHTELAEIHGQQGRVTGVSTRDGRTIRCGLVAAAIGVRPRSELAKGAGLAVSRGVLVDQHLQTSAANIYAAGDVAEILDPASGRLVLDTLWATARSQGTVAGQNMAGEAVPFHRRPPINVTRLACLTTTIIGMVGQGRDADLGGIARGDSEIWRQLPAAAVQRSSSAEGHLRLVIGASLLIGAVIMGDQAVSRPLQDLISAEADITPVRERLLAENAPLATIIADFWRGWRTEHAPQRA